MPEPETNGDKKKPSPDVREAAIAIVRRLVEHEHEAYFAGGCVRDRLLGLTPGDYDIATSARPDDVKKIFRNMRFVGESFGVMLVRSKGHTIEIATFRTDGVYSDNRHPDEVQFSDAEHDALRRDFTINGMFEDPLEDRIIDYVGGRADLEARVIRAIGDAESRLREDHLRMLRAVRFAARFGCSIEEHTADAIRANAEHLAGISRERIGEEVKRMMRDKSRGVAAWELQYLGLDKRVLREGHCLAAPTRLGRLPEQTSYPTTLAAWLLDRYPEESCQRRKTIAKRWVESLVLSNHDAAALIRILEIHDALLHGWEKSGVAKQKRLAADELFDDALSLVQADDRPLFVDLRRRVQELAESGLSPTPLIDGDDLIEAGFEPGPQFKSILDAVYDAQLEGNVEDRVDALRLAQAVHDSGYGAE